MGRTGVTGEKKSKMKADICSRIVGSKGEEV